MANLGSAGTRSRSSVVPITAGPKLTSRVPADRPGEPDGEAFQGGPPGVDLDRGGPLRLVGRLGEPEDRAGLAHDPGRSVQDQGRVIG